MPRPASPERRRPGARPMVAALAAVTLLTTGVAASSTTTAAAPAAPVAPELVAQVENARSGEPVRALLMLPNAEELTGDRTEVLETLRGHADDTQAELELNLEQRTDGVTVLNRFWLTNMVLVEFPAAGPTLDALASTPGVDRVIPNFELTAPEPSPNIADVAPNAELTWGLQKIEAARVWEELGIDGSGVRVATLDTGVDISHPDLAGKMVTDNPADPNHPGGWMEFNSTGGRVASAPRDSAYHGTHVSGTIHGGATSGTAIGVATGAELMHGLVIPGGSGSFAQVAAGMQWAIAPTDAAGNPAGRAADVVNMSLGANGFYPEMIQPTRAMRAAGVFPAFAIGNNCATGGTGSPGNVFEAVGVGATDVSDNVAGFSCGGVVRKNQWTDPPADWPESWVKPDLSAPGADVLSASPGGGYRTLSGTSMATPHTAGTVALMRSAAADLSVDEILDVLGDTAFWDDRYATAPPDTRFGVGRINAFEATSFVALNSGIEGVVTDAAGGAPVAGATVTVSPGEVTVTTGADGTFTRRLAPGTYTVTVEAFGYRSTTVSDVTVTENAFATVAVGLDAAPGGQVVGTVVLTESGSGIPGVTVRVAGVPTDLSAVTGANGTYTIPRVPSGTYQIVASHPTFRAPAPVEVTVSPEAAARADFGFGVPARSVAIVDSAASRAAQYRDVVFAPRGIETAIYNWDQLPQAAAHATVVLGYGTLSIDYDAADFQAFLDATDANGTGVIFTDHSFGSGNGIKQLSEHTGQPVSYGSNSGGSGSAESYYEVTQEHPLLEGYSVGDRIVIDDSTRAKWVAWFDGYEGEGRKLLGNLGRTADGVLGGGIGVDERATNRHVLLSTHGVSATRGPADWTDEATRLFLNAVNWASPPPAPNQPYFAPYNLRVVPDVVQSDDDVLVLVDVKNIGATAGRYEAVLRVNGVVEKTTPVTLAPGAATMVGWTLSRDDLGTYTVQVGHLSDSFRVRAPIVQLSASTVDAPGAAAVGALAGATVELIADGQVRSLGTTGADGKLTFEIPDPVGRYTLVVRRPTGADGSPGYLLHREITVIDDESISFAPRVLAGSAAAGVGDNFAVRATIDLDSTDERHSGSVYLRPSGTAPHGYRYQPGTLIASLDRYEAVAVHEVLHLEQDWLMPSRVVGGLDWIDPFDTTFSFGGAPTVSLGDVTVGEGGRTTVPWSVTDAHGLPFATVLASDVRPFYTLPDRAALESVEGLLRAAVPNELKPVLRLFDPAGKPLRAGSIGWNAQPYTFTFDPNAPDGEYRVKLDVATGGYAGLVSDETSLRIGPIPLPEVSISDTRGGTAAPGTAMRYDVRAANAGTADSGPLAWTVRVTAEHAPTPQNVVLRVQVDGAWQRVQLRRDGAALVGTVVADASVAAGAARTWPLSVQFQGAGTYTVADSFAGTGVAVSNADMVIVASPVPVGTR